MIFHRKQEIRSHLKRGRALIIYGPRRIGKTTLLKAYLKEEEEVGKRTFYRTGDDIKLRELFASEIQDDILDLARTYDIVAIDEAQQIPSIGLGAKMIVDAFPEKTLILTGSSSFDLAQEVGEPLTGRHFTLTLLPLAQSEMESSAFELKNALPDFLVYGSYPEILNEPDKEQKVRILNELVNSYLFKDILALDKVRSPDVLRDVARCLAFQVGSEVSQNEIARTVKSDVKTVGRYLDILEKMFVVKRVRGFSRNLRNEISKKAKYYFLDTGVRNAVISQFNDLPLRNDKGALWESFIFMELYKQSVIANRQDTYYFWRTHVGQEVDIVRDSGVAVAAIECKWSDGSVVPPSAWRKAYPKSSFVLINKENYLNHVRKVVKT